MKVACLLPSLLLVVGLFHLVKSDGVDETSLRGSIERDLEDECAGTEPGYVCKYPFKKEPEKMARCRGDCDSDDDCDGNDLMCYRRSIEEGVPGCFGLPIGKEDYCVAKIDVKLPGELYRYRKARRYRPMARCHGDCNNDDECVGHLICLQRNKKNNDPVEGCLGTPILGTDYCVDPPETPAPTTSPMPEPETAEPTTESETQVPTTSPTPTPESETQVPSTSPTPTPESETQVPTSPTPTPEPTKGPMPTKPPTSTPPCPCCIELTRAGIVRPYLPRLVSRFKKAANCGNPQCINKNLEKIRKLKKEADAKKGLNKKQKKVLTQCVGGLEKQLKSTKGKKSKKSKRRED